MITIIRIEQVCDHEDWWIAGGGTQIDELSTHLVVAEFGGGDFVALPIDPQDDRKRGGALKSSGAIYVGGVNWGR